MENSHEFPLIGKTIVFTGSLETFSRANQQQIAAHFGAICTGQLGSDTAFLVVGKDHVSEVKLRQAAKLGVEIINEEELLERMAFKPFSPHASDPLDQPATDAQLRALEQFGITADGPLTTKQANTMLSVRDYVQALARVMRREGESVSEDAELVTAAVMITDKDLSRYAAEWNAKRFARGTHDSSPRLRSDGVFARMYAEMKTATQKY